MWIWDMSLTYAKRQKRVFQAELCLMSTVLETEEMDEELLYSSPHRIYSLTPGKVGMDRLSFRKSWARQRTLIVSLCISSS